MVCQSTMLSVYNFWFNELTSEDWFRVNDEVDNTIKTRFSDLLNQAIAGECALWRSSAKGALCEIIVLDQFSRNIYRNTEKAFSQDPQALSLAQFAIEKGQDKALSLQEVGFLYLPFMHSESVEIHGQAEQLYQNHPSYEYELAHKTIIERFGRYPHRNAILNRASSPEEIAFMNEPNSSF